MDDEDIVIPQLPQQSADNELPHTYTVRNPEAHIRVLKNRFDPAIKNGLLEIAVIEITQEEFEKLESEVNSAEQSAK